MTEDTKPEYEKIIYENEVKGFQLRVVVSNFRDIDYIHIRKYFLSFDSGFIPTKEGISIPMSIQNVYSILDALVEICSKAEGIDSITEHFAKKISDLKSITE